MGGYYVTLNQAPAITYLHTTTSFFFSDTPTPETHTLSLHDALPIAIETLRDYDVPWAGHAPRGIDGLERETWDFVITVCDRAKESCPIFPGQPILAHWGMPDPADVVGDEAAQRQAFEAAFLLLSRRIDLLLALPIEKLERLALEARVRTIGHATGGSTG